MILMGEARSAESSLPDVQLFRYIFAAKNPDACVGDESRINKVKRIFFFTAPKKEGFFFV